jgi:hypothetical protein
MLAGSRGEWFPSLVNPFIPLSKVLSDYRLPNPPNTISHSIGGTGVSPVQAQAEACGYQNLAIIKGLFSIFS